MIIKFGDTEQEVVFLREQDLRLLKMFNLQLTDLTTLPAIREVSDEDCLSWLEFQRAVEKQFAGFKSTTYTQAGEIKNLYGERVSAPLFKAKYDEVLKSDKTVKITNHLYGYDFNGKVFILIADNTVENKLFRPMPGNLATAVMRVCLDTVSTFGFYFKYEKQLSKSSEQRGYITAGTLLSKVLA